MYGKFIYYRKTSYIHEFFESFFQVDLFFSYTSRAAVTIKHSARSILWGQENPSPPKQLPLRTIPPDQFLFSTIAPPDNYPPPVQFPPISS